MLSYFHVEASIHRPSFFLFFSLTIKDKTKISLPIKILHLGQGSFTRKVRTIFTLKIIVSIFVKLFLILVLHLRQFFIVRIFVKRATGFRLLIITHIYIVTKNAFIKVYQWFYWTLNSQFWEKSQSVPGAPKPSCSVLQDFSWRPCPRTVVSVS